MNDAYKAYPEAVTPTPNTHKRPSPWRKPLRYGGLAIGALLMIAVGGGIERANDPVVPATNTAAAAITVPMPAATATVTVPAAAPATATVTVTVPPTPGKAVTEGQWLAGRDIEPGSYKTDGQSNGASGDCYWNVADDAGGMVGKTLKNHISKGPSQFTVKANQWVEITWCTFRKIG